ADPETGEEIQAQNGRYGPYLKKGTDTRSLPSEDDIFGIDLAGALELFAQPKYGNRRASSALKEFDADPVSGKPIKVKDGRFGPYVTELLGEPAEGTPKSKQPKPRTGSLFKSMSLDTVTLADALKLLSLPRVVGTDRESGDEITAQNGRYGPYLKKGTDSRSLSGEDELFTVNLEEALKIYAQPKQRGRGRASATPPLRELGTDPATGKQMVIKDGRFGPYVTEGETNASLRKGDSVEEITDARAAELLAERRAKAGTAPKKRAAPRTPRSRAKAASGS
ncbi:MAG TPA: topoisomerase C-terminal repeat-containing protein, partial [Pseudonocardia sp.]